MEELLDQMTSAELWPVLLLTVPYMPWYRGLVHPLTLALHGFMEKENTLNQQRSGRNDGDELAENPRIVFLNLDGS